MELQDREVTLKLKSRPLRCAYLVRNREDLLDAIALYTHVWGGCANAILPIPNDDQEIDDLRSTLGWMNPDYVFIPREEIPSKVSSFLGNLPILIRPISKLEVEQHINGTRDDRICLRSGWLSYIVPILSAIYQNPIEESDIHLIDEGKTFNLEMALHLGLPSQPYRNYLTKYLAASSFLRPKNIGQLLEILLIATKINNPSSITLLKTTRKYDLNRYIYQTNDPETLCLFLDDGKDIGITTAFWNCRWIFPQNKIFLPREDFLRDIKIHALKIIEFMPYIRALYVTTPCNQEEAFQLYSDLKSTFADIDREILVRINYQDFHFDWVPGMLSSGETAHFTRVITPEGCVRFDPYIPIGHEKTKFVIGYDSEVKFKSGKRFFSPKNLIGSHLLTNELWRLEYLDTNKDNLGKLWLKSGLPVRADSQGISGTALPGQECSFYIHPDQVIITQQLKDAGLELRPNKHTRYARGLVKRFGGLERVLNLINDGGFDVMSALASRSEIAARSYQENIKGFLVKSFNLHQRSADEIINRKIGPLLSSGLIRRGYSLKCPHCDLENWFLLEEIREFLDCRGCAESFQLPLHGIKFAFELNELATRLIYEGGLAVLITAGLLKRIPDKSSGFLQFGGDLFPIGNKVNSNEVDLFWLTEKAFIIAECKSFFDVNFQLGKQELGKRIKQIEYSLTKNIDLAKRIGAKVVLLGVATNLSEISGIFDMVAELAKTAKAQGIGLHLALNNKIYLMGDKNGINPREITLDDLLIEEDALLNERSVGESPSYYGGAVGSHGLFNKETLERWRAEFKKTG